VRLAAKVELKATSRFFSIDVIEPLESSEFLAALPTAVIPSVTKAE